MRKPRTPNPTTMIGLNPAEKEFLEHCLSLYRAVVAHPKPVAVAVVGASAIQTALLRAAGVLEP